MAATLLPDMLVPSERPVLRFAKSSFHSGANYQFAPTVFVPTSCYESPCSYDFCKPYEFHKPATTSCSATPRSSAESQWPNVPPRRTATLRTSADTSSRSIHSHTSGGRGRG